MHEEIKKPDTPEGLSFINKDGRLAITDGRMSLSGDYEHMLPRIRQDRLAGELIVKASGIMKMSADPGKRPLAIDATAGLGEDSLLLAAAGYRVIMFEKDPVIAALLKDTLIRAADISGMKEAVSRMELREENSICGMKMIGEKPDLVFLDPMFPERRKSALVKKKLQLIQRLEKPQEAEDELFKAALAVCPERIIVKRPLKGPYIAGIKPSNSVSGKQIRYDCYIGA